MLRTPLLLSACSLFSALSAQVSLAPGQSRTETNALGQTVVLTAASAYRLSAPARDWPVVADDGLAKSEQNAAESERPLHPVVNANALPVGGDPSCQTAPTARSLRSPIENFAGQNGAAFPPDPSGAAGPNHYVQAVNNSYRIYSKTGIALGGPFNLNSLWPGSSGYGDPIVLYDRHADRWFISQINGTPTGVAIAVSETGDPLGAYHVYTYSFGAAFPDYPKYSVWWDGYYMTSNSNKTAVVFNRDKMLTGDPTAEMIALTAPSVINPGFSSVLPADADGDLPPAGTPCYFFNLEDDNWGGVPVDRIKIYTMTTDWVTIANTNVVQSQLLTTDPFDTSLGSGFDNIQQTGTTQLLDGVAEIFYFRAQHTRWSTYNSVVLCHVVDVGVNHAGMRWYELRDANDGVFSIYQQGTWSPDDANRWMGSIAMDNSGNIGMAYSVSDVANGGFPSLRYTGRLAADPLGQMTFFEQEGFTGVAAQTGINRFGDYSQLTLDPDGSTLWFTGEYIGPGGATRTRIFSFDIAASAGVGEEVAPIGPAFTVTLDNETVNATINGLASDDALRFDVITLDGRTLLARDARPSGGSWSTTIARRDLSPAVYFLRVSDPTFQKVQRIVIEK